MGARERWTFIKALQLPETYVFWGHRFTRESASDPPFNGLESNTVQDNFLATLIYCKPVEHWSPKQHENLAKLHNVIIFCFFLTCKVADSVKFVLSSGAEWKCERIMLQLLLQWHKQKAPWQRMKRVSASVFKYLATSLNESFQTTVL